MKTVAFILSMPGKGSWNGKWSGERDLYAIVHKFSKSKESVADSILDKKYFSYSWPDGWRASVEAREVSGQEIKNLKKHSRGFCGYDWMVSSIIKNGYISAS